VKKLYLLPALLIASSLGLVACGGGGDDDESAVIKTIEVVVHSTNPADCKKYATQDFLEQSQFEKGAAALKECEEDADDTEDDPDSVKVTKVEIDGSDATAEASFEGGTFDGQALSIGLVEEDGTWKMDELIRFAKLDRARLVDAFEKGITTGGNALPQPIASCIAAVLRELPKDELERVVIGGDPQAIVEIVEGCQQGNESSEA
jgi:hypothetical protein